LGRRFAAELDRVLDSLAEMPDSFPPVDRSTRVARVRPFAYGVYFRIEGDGAVVIAVRHLHRRPGSWKRPRDR
jgi:plasmid stabilization system protein ParE